METFNLLHDVIVFGKRVATFPAGVADTFDALMKQVPDGNKRHWYGLSKQDEKGDILYWAAAEEKIAGEAAKYAAEPFMIPHGEYLAVTVQDWHSKTACIKDVFHEMMQDERADHTQYCIEWYKTDKEMLCLLQVNPVKAIRASIDTAAATLLDLLSGADEKKLNTIPFEDSWTAAQLADHVTKSNRGIAQALDMKGVVNGRDAAARTRELAAVFLDFSTKLKSPQFIVPRQQLYEKETVLEALKKSNAQLKEKAGKVIPAEMISHPALGEITKLELLHFVVYHTQRHIHQLKNILRHV